MTKYCPRCMKDLDHDFFGLNKTTRDGLQTYCLICRKDYYKKYKAKILTKQKEYYIKHRIEKIEYANKYQKANPEIHRKANRKYYFTHSERNKEYYQKNKKKFISKAKIWMKKLKEENPEKYKALKKSIKHRRRVLEAKAEGYFTAKDIQNLYNDQHGKCYYCKKDLNNNYDIDHKIPLVRGGTNWPNNLCCSCSKCNRNKFTKTDKEFLLEISGG